MQTIREKLDGKVWRAVQAMIDGLKEQSKRGDYQIDMHTYGAVHEGTCYGCAATCAIQKIAGRNFNLGNIKFRDTRAETLGYDLFQLTNFEEAINDFRRGGYMLPLFNFMAKPYPEQVDQYFLLHDQIDTLTTDNWHEVLPQYQALCDHLKRLNV